MATPNAKERGWGAIGAPGSAAGRRYERENIVTVRAGGIAVRLHRRVAPLFQAAIDEVVARGYRLDRVADDWGHVHRFIRGRERGTTATLYARLSNHSWGLAADLNATTNPMGDKLVTDMTPWVVETFARFGLSWGGRYRTRPDAMHYEFLGTPAEADRLVALLRAAPPPPPIEEDDTMAIIPRNAKPKAGRWPAVDLVDVTDNACTVVVAPPIALLSGLDKIASPKFTYGPKAFGNATLRVEGLPGRPKLSEAPDGSIVLVTAGTLATFGITGPAK